MTQNPRVNAALVEALGSALREGEHGLKTGPALLVRVLREGSWRSFVTQRGEQVEYHRFEQFVMTPPLRGLGGSMRLIDKMIASIDAADERTAARDLLDRTMQRSIGSNQHTEGLYVIQTLGAPSGTSREAGLRRLRKDRPDLHAEVLAGRLSTHAAMVRAGFRRRKITVPVDTPQNAARALRRNLAPEALEELARLLADG